MNVLGMLAVAGMLIGVIGLGHLGDSARPFAWGFAVSVAVLVHWINSLQKQLDALKSATASRSSDRDMNQGG